MQQLHLWAGSFLYTLNGCRAVALTYLPENRSKKHSCTHKIIHMYPSDVLMQSLALYLFVAALLLSCASQFIQNFLVMTLMTVSRNLVQHLTQNSSLLVCLTPKRVLHGNTRKRKNTTAPNSSQKSFSEDQNGSKKPTHLLPSVNHTSHAKLQCMVS